MSLLEKLADELGVRVGESWEAEGVHECPKTYVIRDNTLKTLVHYEEEGIGHCGEWIEASMADYVALIKGELRPVWEPKEREKYFVPFIGYKTAEELYDIWDWAEESKVSKWHKEKGLIFRTKEEAIEMANKMLKLAKGEGK